jgi:hypothetical protein
MLPAYRCPADLENSSSTLAVRGADMGPVREFTERAGVDGLLRLMQGARASVYNETTVGCAGCVQRGLSRQRGHRKCLLLARQALARPAQPRCERAVNVVAEGQEHQAP